MPETNRLPPRRRPRLLTIAGSDSGGGAGIQADLKTFAAHGAYGMSVVTAVTAQNTRAVTAVHEIPPEIVGRQIDAVFDDLGVDAVKIGMLSSAPLIETVAGRLADRRDQEGSAEPLPIVLDPVMVAKSGAALLADEAVATLAGRLLPLATLVTPNLPEAERLAGMAVASEGERLAAAQRISRAAGGDTDAGPAVLVKGGHGEGDELVDLLWDPRRSGDARVERILRPRLATTSTHGTGCTLSSAIAARLGRGETLADAVRGAIDYLHGAIAAAEPLGGGHGPVDHLYRLRGTDG